MAARITKSRNVGVNRRNTIAALMQHGDTAEMRAETTALMHDEHQVEVYMAMIEHCRSVKEIARMLLTMRYDGLLRAHPHCSAC